MIASDARVAASAAVITVSYRSESVLPEFLASVKNASPGSPTVIVADNLPGPMSQAKPIASAGGAEYLAMTANLGYGGAVNRAVATLSPDIEWLLISNPDVRLAPGSLSVLLRVISSDSSIGAVGPAIYTSEGVRYPSARAVPSLRTGIGHALFANLWASNPWTKAYHNDRSSSGVGNDAGWLSGACLLVRREAFDAIGGFDEEFFMYFEDVDLGHRLGLAGYRNVYEPEASVIHSGAHATTSESAAMIVAHHESALHFLKKKYSGPVRWPVRWAAGLGLSIRSALIRRRLNSSLPRGRRR